MRQAYRTETARGAASAHLPAMAEAEPVRVTVSAEQLGLQTGYAFLQAGRRPPSYLATLLPLWTGSPARLGFCGAALQPMATHACSPRHRQETESHLDFDLGNLMAADLSPVDVRPPGEGREADLAAAATQATQALVAQLFQLPGRLVGMGRVVELPAPSYPLPRQKPLPAPRPPTRHCPVCEPLHQAPSMLGG